MNDLEPRSACDDDLTEVAALLSECHLPTDDVPDIISQFWVVRSASELVGTIALERYGKIGLLRSLAVAPVYRSQGAARLLCDHLLQQARMDCITDLYLLTTDADAYFERLGFKSIDRDHVPAEIRNTTQFAELCPDSAIVMVRRANK